QAEVTMGGGRKNKTGLVMASPSITRPVSALANSSNARSVPNRFLSDISVSYRRNILFHRMKRRRVARDFNPALPGDDSPLCHHFGQMTRANSADCLLFQQSPPRFHGRCEARGAFAGSSVDRGSGHAAGPNR